MNHPIPAIRLPGSSVRSQAHRAIPHLCCIRPVKPPVVFCLRETRCDLTRRSQWGRALCVSSASRRVEWEQLVIRRISAGWSSCCGNPNLAGDGADEWAGSLCVAQGYSGEIANLAKLQIGRIASAGQSSDNRQPTPLPVLPKPDRGNRACRLPDAYVPTIYWEQFICLHVEIVLSTL